MAVKFRMQMYSSSCTTVFLKQSLKGKNKEYLFIHEFIVIVSS